MINLYRQNDRKFRTFVFSICMRYINTIPVNGQIYIILGIPQLIKKCQGKLMILSTDMEIKYKGAFSEKEYNQKLSFYLSVEIVEDHYKMELYNMSLGSTGLHS